MHLHMGAEQEEKSGIHAGGNAQGSRRCPRGGVGAVPVHYNERRSPSSCSCSAGFQQRGVSTGHHFERMCAQDSLTRYGRACEARPEAVRLDAHLCQDVRRLPAVPQCLHGSLAGQDVTPYEPRACLHQVLGKALRAFAFQHCRMRVVSWVWSSRLPPSPCLLCKWHAGVWRLGEEFVVSAEPKVALFRSLAAV